jgi:lactate dehydrogenase-like 2-hydroxyacid dehydrogenase
VDGRCRDGGRRCAEPEKRRSRPRALHYPLTPENHYLINAAAIGQMKPGVMLINTSRGGLVDTKAVIAGIKSAKIGDLGIDVYEQEADLFSEDLSNTIIQDDDFQLLQSLHEMRCRRSPKQRWQILLNLSRGSA